jgi:hypothetical protein
MQNLVAQAIAKKYPCASTLTASDVSSILRHEYEKELLTGDPDPGTMEALAGAVGARYLVYVTVIQNGGTSLVTVTLMDEKTAKVTGRESQTIPVNSGALDALTALSGQFVNSLGSAFTKCTTGWKGTVTVEFIQDEELRGMKRKGEGTLECTLTGADSEAKCSMHGEATWTSSSGNLKSRVSGEAPSASVVVSLNNGRLHLGLPTLKVNSSLSAATDEGSGSVDNEEDLDGGAYDVPASGDEKHQAGSFSQPGTQASKVVVTWNLTKD